MLTLGAQTGSKVGRIRRVSSLSMLELYVTDVPYAGDFVALTCKQRTCPGQQFALTSAAYALVRICQRFVHIESLTGASTPRMTYGLAQMHMDGVKVQFATSNPTHLSSSAHHPLPLPSPPVAREKLRGGNNILGKALEWLIMPYFGREMMQLGIGDAEW